MSAAKLRSTAIHEAGHAVVHVVLGRRIDRVSIVPGDENLGHIRGRVISPQMAEAIEFGTLTTKQMAAADDAIVALLADPIAETKFRGRRNLVGAESDHEGAANLAYRLCGSADEVEAYLKEMEDRADDLVETHWADIESVVPVLLERKVLSGTAVRRIIRDARRSNGDKVSESAPSRQIERGGCEEGEARVQIAYHEAGHAVMSVLLKRRLDRVSINTRGGKVGFVSRYGFRQFPPLTEGLRKQWALVAVAGPAAETIHCLEAGGAADRHLAEGWLSDHEAVELLGCDCGPMFDGSVEFLRSQWSLVEAVATALLDAPGGYLTGKQVRHLTPRIGRNGH